MTAAAAAAAAAFLMQLEAAGGGEDSEARARLDQLRQQLGELEQAKQRATAADGPAGLAPFSASSAAGTGLPGDAAAMLQHMDR